MYIYIGITWYVFLRFIKLLLIKNVDILFVIESFQSDNPKISL